MFHIVETAPSTLILFRGVPRHLIRPHFEPQRDIHIVGSTRLRTILQALLQLLSARALQLTSQPIHARTNARPLQPASLGTLLTALLALLAIRTRVGADELRLLLRNAHAVGQLLLPQVTSHALDSTSPLIAEEELWRSFDWRLQLHTWPLSDRFEAARADSVRPVSQGAAPSTGERFLRWMQREARPEGRANFLCCLLLGAAVPALPSKQALELFLGECEASGAPLQLAEVHAAMAIGLMQVLHGCRSGS